MGITEDRGRFYFVMRIPKRYQNVDTRSQVRQALHTDSRSEAIRKAPAIEEQFIAYWEDLLTGNDADAKTRWDTARRLAASKGFVYKPIEDLASGPIEDLLAGWRLSLLKASFPRQMLCLPFWERLKHPGRFYRLSFRNILSWPEIA